ncbi:MAG: hypothetical protein UR85_C0007G0033 [Candidatus Nomurabacteria bacterium GW2011_GWF2_35_66]|uniref:Uncharacterized protein n=1 Tax=Candidatus Nomurabacteria bacterium GW2011_GWE1_35_16 TaxID=1618761 RepID=A0A0G0EGC8_9BACT|nr:MAG: hypothetical protein UR55_C0009G0026 [Candidatus Nomurabacteria bacterium GW2011_GWF1_34_20]KKP62983.1 MAG: hypothetical protein UR57_C0009G0026 [Candidatus Nomurabacteria bacterium GW2011_GWE2_34_25]KKP66387.1 MAG: hypothetical protein UR64_C0008G0025 [Candidatus Nomurabacteria bacterium GW2011_GWE1_35_16]KKP83173.1 MAG: hypothetical protein UR85_C0007G0033 [Candidatus Nomurabacteria bacterium GW2011_GWF2_35_66]
MIVSDNLLDYNHIFGLFDALIDNPEYDVETILYIEDARYRLKVLSYDLIVIDVANSPFGQFSLEETQGGNITGIVWCEKELLGLGIPILFWSNWEDHPNLVKNFISKYPENKIGFLWRVSLDKNHLSEGIKNFLNY